MGDDLFKLHYVFTFYSRVYMGQSQVIILIIIANIILLIFIGGIFMFVFQYRRRRMEYIEQTKLLEEQHHIEMMAAQLEIQQQTMQYIGREIHDNVGQKLTLVSLYAQQLSYENKAPLINDTIKNIGDIVNESLAELRRLSKSLTDDTINNNSFFDLLQQECEKVNCVNRIAVILNASKKNSDFTYQSKSILLRIVQEFLQNSIKHSLCKKITITMETRDSEFSLLLQDDGSGFDANNIKSNGIGINNMKQRAAVLGATFNLQSNDKKGTQLLIKTALKNITSNT
jgi:signal transduction histidine kinase